MASYSLRKNLPPCLVDEKLLRALETYIRCKAVELDPVAKDHASRYSLTLQDALGEETRESIEHYVADFFPDDIRQLKLSYRSEYGEPLDITVSLGVDAVATLVRVEYRGSAPREVAVGIVEEVFRRVGESPPTLKWLSLYWTRSLVLFVAVGCPGLVALHLSGWQPLPGYSLSAGVVMGLLVSGLGAGISRWFPFAVFNTRKNERTSKYIRAFGGVIVAITASVIASYVFRLLNP